MGDAPATALSLVALALVLAREVVSFAKSKSEEKPREAALPPAPSHPSLVNADLSAVAARLARVEDRVEEEAARAQGFRERVIAKLARIFERLKIKEEDDGRESR